MTLPGRTLEGAEEIRILVRFPDFGVTGVKADYRSPSRLGRDISQLLRHPRLMRHRRRRMDPAGDGTCNDNFGAFGGHVTSLPISAGRAPEGVGLLDLPRKTASDDAFGEFAAIDQSLEINSRSIAFLLAKVG